VQTCVDLINPSACVISNPLYPIFLKTTQLHILIVGGGYVALERLSFIFKSTTESPVTIVSPMLREGTASFIKGKKINYIQDKYKKSDLENANIVIAITDSPEVNQKVFADCREKHLGQCSR